MRYQYLTMVTILTTSVAQFYSGSTFFLAPAPAIICNIKTSVVDPQLEPDKHGAAICKAPEPIFGQLESRAGAAP